MKAQLDRTLTSLPTVSSVEILIDRNPQEIDPITPVQLPSSPGAPIMLSDTSVYRVNGSTAIPVAGSSTHVIRLQPTAVALSQPDEIMALVNSEGLYLASLNESEAELIDSRPGILKPIFDADGFLWSVGAEGGINVYRNGQLSTLVEQGSQTLIDYALSPEGARLVEIVLEDDTPKLQLRGVVRDSDGQPRALTQPLSVRSARPQLVAWLGENQFALVERSITDSTILSVSSLLGETEDAISPPVLIDDLTTVASSIYVLSPLGEIWSRFGNSWRVLVTDGRSVNTAR